MSTRPSSLSVRVARSSSRARHEASFFNSPLPFPSGMERLSVSTSSVRVEKIVPSSEASAALQSCSGRLAADSASSNDYGMGVQKFSSRFTVKDRLRSLLRHAFARKRPLVSCLVNKFSIVDAAFDLKGGFGPTEGFGVFVPVGQEAGDGLLQARDAVEAAAANGLRGDQAEPALDQVEPRGAGRGEVQMKARMGGQPVLYRGMLVGAVVVADQMQFQLGVALGQRLQEGDELGVPMAPVATRMDLAAGHLQRGEQAGGTVTQVITRSCGRAARADIGNAGWVRLSA